MKIRNVLILVLVVALIAVIATWQFCKGGMEDLPNGNVGSLNTHKPKKPDKSDVTFKVAGDTQSLEMVSPVCGNNKGCFKANKGESGLTTFKFTDEFGGWQLNKLTICKYQSDETLDCKLGVWERLDFFASDDEDGSNIFSTDSNGVIDLSKFKPSVANETVFYLLNQNAIKMKYYYTIEACKAGANPTCIATDPDIDNKGRN